MNYLLSFMVFPSLAMCTEFALLFLRLGIGIIIAIHGFQKLFGGQKTWSWLGTAMSLIGVKFLPTMWGFFAMLVELLGGILLTIGLCTKIASFFLVFDMFVAILFHLHNGDSFSKYSVPISYSLIFLTFAIIGGGYYSLDYYFFVSKLI